MVYNEESALKVAELLLQIKAIVLQPHKPFTWASGWQSPIYCDNRKILSYPTIRNHIRKELSQAVEEKFGKPDVIVGVATGAIAHGVMVAQTLNLPFAYVRSSAKAHGLSNLIEGVVEEGQQVVVIEDLISTGGSSLAAVEALRERGCKVKGMAAIFSYGFDVAQMNFLQKNVTLTTLCDYDALLRRALEIQYIKEELVPMLKEWRVNPKEWESKV